MEYNITSLKAEINNIMLALDYFVYGSIEIREIKEHKYIYVHYRSNGILKCKYAGEYSRKLIEVINNNTEIVKSLKKKLKSLQKLLNEFQVNPIDITDKVKLNVDLARKYLVESIYKQSVLEGIATTFIDTDTLINEGIVNNMRAIDVEKILNLKHAWEFILDIDVLGYQTNFDILCQINGLVEEGISSQAGKLRSIPVRIGGSNYTPPIPFTSDIKDNINKIVNESKDEVRNCAKLIAYIMKTQAFLDGNKRTAIILGNHYLINHGLGLMVVPVEKINEYKKLVLEYYENISDKLIDFLINECYIPL